MQLHYFTLIKIAKDINENARGAVVCEVFTQEKNQLVLGFGLPGHDYYLRVSCGAPLPFISISDQYGKARKNVMNLFPGIIDLEIENCSVLDFERTLIIDLKGKKNVQLVLKMHGVHSNVFTVENGRISDRFIKNRDTGEKPEFQPGFFDDDWKNKEGLFEKNNILKSLKKISPVFEKKLAGFIERKIDSGMDFNSAVELCLDELNNDKYYIENQKGKILFLLCPPDPESLFLEVSGLRNSLKAFFSNWYRMNTYYSVWDLLNKKISSQKNYFEGQLNSAYKSIEAVDEARSNEELANILMANIHLLETGKKEVELYDFYSDKKIKIKLKPDLNGQQNAEYYYQKNKKNKTRVRVLEQRITELESENERLGSLMKEFTDFPVPEMIRPQAGGPDPALIKGINAFAETHLSAIQGTTKSDHSKGNPFLNFSFLGYTIYAGRNAKQNDELSFRFGKKNDIWLHARDSAGSHVIIRKKGQETVPTNVIEYAASIAATNSKRKREQLVPVQYTELKYVRKLKGGAPGQVLVDREKVVMVAPMEQEG